MSTNHKVTHKQALTDCVVVSCSRMRPRFTTREDTLDSCGCSVVAFFTVNLLNCPRVPVGRNDVLTVVVSLMTDDGFSVVLLLGPLPWLGESTSFDSDVLLTREEFSTKRFRVGKRSLVEGCVVTSRSNEPKRDEVVVLLVEVVLVDVVRFSLFRYSLMLKRGRLSSGFVRFTTSPLVSSEVKLANVEDVLGPNDGEDDGSRRFDLVFCSLKLTRLFSVSRVTSADLKGSSKSSLNLDFVRVGLTSNPLLGRNRDRNPLLSLLKLNSDVGVLKAAVVVVTGGSCVTGVSGCSWSCSSRLDVIRFRLKVVGSFLRSFRSELSSAMYGVVGGEMVVVLSSLSMSIVGRGRNRNRLRFGRSGASVESASMDCSVDGFGRRLRPLDLNIGYGVVVPNSWESMKADPMVTISGCGSSSRFSSASVVYLYLLRLPGGSRVGSEMASSIVKKLWVMRGSSVEESEMDTGVVGEGRLLGGSPV